MAFLDKVAAKVLDQPLDRNKQHRRLDIQGPAFKVSVTLMKTDILHLSFLSGEGWQCIWNKDHTHGTVQTILEQKFDTDLVLMRMCLS
jgi:hypothetical protein